MGIEQVGSVLLPLIFAGLTGAIGARRAPTPEVRKLVWIGLTLHLAGGLLYLVVVSSAYGGGDYLLYYQQAVSALEASGLGGPMTLWDRYVAVPNGTTATSLVTWWIAIVTGPSLVGLFISFAVIGFVGVLCFGAAFEHAFPELDPATYYRWLMLYPSLWFWPSGLGKEALILAGIGIATVGFVGKAYRNWLLVLLGMAIVFFIRPQYVLVLVTALVLSVLLGVRRNAGTLQRVAALSLVIVATIYALPVISDSLGYSATDIDAATEWIDARAEDTSYGGSSYTTSENPILALGTTLFRPFPWEASGLLMLGISAEVVLLWGFALWRRREIAAFLRTYWRTEPALLAICFVVLLGAAAGLAVGNFGTLVRQRIHLYPFLFMILGGLPRVPSARQAYQARAGIGRRQILRRSVPT